METQLEKNSGIKSVKTLPNRQVSTIFATMAAIYGQKFMASFRTEDDLQAARTVWARSLHFLDEHQVSRALKKCAYTADWNPNIPEFIRMALDLPDENLSVARVIGNDCVDPVSKAIRKKIGSWDIGHQPQSVIKSRVLGMYPDIYMSVIEEICE